MAIYQARIKGINYLPVRANSVFEAQRAVIIELIKGGAPGLLRRWLLNGAEVQEVVNLKRWIEKHFDRSELNSQVDICDDASIVIL